MPVLNLKRQLTLPKRLCDRLRWIPGDQLDIVEYDGCISILKRSSAVPDRALKPPSIRHHELSGGKAGLRTYVRIADAWNLSNNEQRRLIGNPSASTYLRWKRDRVALRVDAIERISSVLGIYKALHTLFPNAEQADAWIRKPNLAAFFGGGTESPREFRRLFVVSHAMTADSSSCA